MTDTGQVPGEGLPGNAGMVDQPGMPAPGAYTYLDPSAPATEDEDVLLMPSSQGGWGDPQVVPAETHAAYAASGGYAVPEGYAANGGYAVPEGYATQEGYVAPDGYAVPEGYAAPAEVYAGAGAAGDPGQGAEAYANPEQAQVQQVAVQQQVPPIEQPAPTAEPVAQTRTETQMPAQAQGGPAMPGQQAVAEARHAYGTPEEPEFAPAGPDATASAQAVPEAGTTVPDAGQGPEAAAGTQAPHQPDAHETGGRDTGSVDLSGVRMPAPPTPAPAPGPAAPTPPRRPLHLGPPVPDPTGGVVRSLADRGPAGAPSRTARARKRPQQAQAQAAAPVQVPVQAPAQVQIQAPPQAAPAVAVEQPAVAGGEGATPPGPSLGEMPPRAGEPWTTEAPAEPQPRQQSGPGPATAEAEAPAETVVPEAVPTPAPEQVTEPAGTTQAHQEVPTPQEPQPPQGEEAPEAAAAEPAAQPAAEPVPVPEAAVAEPAAVAEVPVPEAPAEPAPVTETPAPVAEARQEPEPAVQQEQEQEPVVQQVQVQVTEPEPVPEPAAEAVPEERPEAQAEPAQATEPAQAQAQVHVQAEVQVQTPDQAEAPAPETEPATEQPVVQEAAPEPDPQPSPEAEPVAEDRTEAGRAPAAEEAEVPAAPPAPESVPEPAPEPAAAPASEQPREHRSERETAPEAPQEAQEAAPDPVSEPEPARPAPATAQAAQPAADSVPDSAPQPAPAAEALTESRPESGTEAEAESGTEAETAATAPATQDEIPGTPAESGYDDAEREAVLRVMRERRDIRNGFRPDPIPHEVLLRVLEAAHTAPSVGHSQPWDFVVIRSAETRRSMHELAQRQRDAYAKSLPKGRAKQFKELKIEAILDTPVNIVVTADPTRGGRHTLGRHTQPQMAPYSSALAVENLWLAARAEGLGVGWVSFFDEREMVRTLGLPEHLEVVAYLCVGYVDEFPQEPELLQAGWSKRRPLSWVVHEETYGRRALPGEDPHNLLQETITGIRPLDAKALGEAWERQKRMTKPAGALGMLEIISAQLSGLSRMCPPPIPEPAAVAVFAGDHGVHAQGVTPWPQEVTGQMVANFLAGGAVCNAFATQVGAEVCVVDVGVASELPATPGLLPRKVRAGTADFTTGHALTREEVLSAIEVGIETARDLVAAGNKALLTGEMGIANTTVSAALICVYTGQDPAEVTGRGTGVNDETHARKVDVVRRALELHQPDPSDPIGVLAAVGGLEHAALVGFLLGGASMRTPVVLDGVSAGAAALVARAIAPEALAACIAGHRSAEPGHAVALNKLGLRPLVDLDLRLGEGTGALLALPLIQSAARAMHEVATFDSAGVTEK
ncbi:nicotinate-nucleotide--dimethylbenzimidazole phosphoribosyltransferase [Streptomyces sp. NPDC095613]|uniref:nicotinate-nucleotide--dimethylbenzimidazole phosphoribosyltransferase n=1 Tax=Streptomyces sp. NPDC095613 TaxID=3155540 RepID=UPI003322F6DB